MQGRGWHQRGGTSVGYRKTAKYAEESTQPMGKTKERQGI